MAYLKKTVMLAALVLAASLKQAGAVQPLIDPDTGRPDFIGLKLGGRGGEVPPVGPAERVAPEYTCAQSWGYWVCLEPRETAGTYILYGVVDGRPWRAFYAMHEETLVVVGEGFNAVSDGGALVFKRASGVTQTTVRLLDAFAILVRLHAGEARG